MPTSTEFLSPEESIKVDAALLSSKDKFATRLAIYALRCLKQIAETQQITIEEVTPEQVRDWIKKDSQIQKQLEIDANFENFFTQLVLSSLKPLTKISQDLEIPIQDLTIDQVISGFEKQVSNG